MTPRKKLPIGIQTFSKLREGGYYYADKSGYAVDLANSDGNYFFLKKKTTGGSSLTSSLKKSKTRKLRNTLSQ